MSKQYHQGGPRRVAERLTPTPLQEMPRMGRKLPSREEDVSVLETKRMPAPPIPRTNSSVQNSRPRGNERPLPVPVSRKRVYEASEEEPPDVAYTGQVVVEEDRRVPVLQTWPLCFWLFLLTVVFSVIWPIAYEVRHMHWLFFH